MHLLARQVVIEVLIDGKAWEFAFSALYGNGYFLSRIGTFESSLWRWSRPRKCV